MHRRVASASDCMRVRERLVGCENHGMKKVTVAIDAMKAV